VCRFRRRARAFTFGRVRRDAFNCHRPFPAQAIAHTISASGRARACESVCGEPWGVIIMIRCAHNKPTYDDDDDDDYVRKGESSRSSILRRSAYRRAARRAWTVHALRGRHRCRRRVQKRLFCPLKNQTLRIMFDQLRPIYIFRFSFSVDTTDRSSAAQ